MDDLISRSALLAEYDCQHEGEPGRARKLIEAASTVDAVEVVRCKDCKKRNTVICPMEEKYVEYPWNATKHDDFCSYGERKEND